MTHSYTGSRAHKEYDDRSVVIGSECLLRALCRAHKPILATHERSGRFVKWLF
jgi:hypothetical protein